MKKEKFISDILPLRPRLAGYARSIVKDRDEAEDIVQEVMLKLWTIRENLSGYDSIEALSITITRNLSINRVKKMERSGQLHDGITVESHSPTPLSITEQHDDVGHVMSIIASLPPQQQSMLVMKHFDGLEIAEIAKITGSSAEAVRTNLSRARRRVRDIFIKMHNHGKQI